MATKKIRWSEIEHPIKFGATKESIDDYKRRYILPKLNELSPTSTVEDVVRVLKSL